MHILGQRVLGIALLALLAGLVIIKRSATGSFLKDAGRGGLGVRLTNVFNQVFLTAVIPLLAVGLIARAFEAVDPTRIAIANSALVRGLEIAGFALSLSGYGLMGWAVLALGRRFQVGGSAPRPQDDLVTSGPYRIVRHPMFAGVLGISLGLAYLLQSLAVFAVFAAYLVLVVLIIPVEEAGLRRAYGDHYAAYERKVKRLVPLVF